MNDRSQTIDSALKTARILAFALLVGSPVVMLIVSQVVASEIAPAANDLLLYLLLVVAMIQPALGVVLERMWINGYKSNNKTNMEPAQLLTSLSIVRMALVEAVYIYGLVVFVITGDFVSMLWFYVVGIIWTSLYWPRRSQLERWLERIERR